MTTRIFLADDQDAIRAAYRIILDAQPDMAVIGEAGDGLSAVEQTRHLRPDVVLADIRMPGLDGLEVTKRLADQIRVVVVTTFDLDEYVHTALRNGACGFVLKRSSPTLLAEAVRAAMAGDVLISPQLTVRLLRQAPRSPQAGPVEPLTDREIEVARLVAEGLTNAQIAQALFLAPGTVKNHIAVVQRKVGARNRVGIAAWAPSGAPPGGAGLTGCRSRPRRAGPSPRPTAAPWFARWRSRSAPRPGSRRPAGR